MAITHKAAEIFQEILESVGYSKMNRKYKNEDWSWWKVVTNEHEDDEGRELHLYQMAVLFYDFSKYEKHVDNPIGISFEVICHNHMIDGRYDMSITDDTLSIHDFESLAERYYDMLVAFTSDMELKGIQEISGA